MWTGAGPHSCLIAYRETSLILIWDRECLVPYQGHDVPVPDIYSGSTHYSYIIISAGAWSGQIFNSNTPYSRVIRLSFMEHGSSATDTSRWISGIKVLKVLYKKYFSDWERLGLHRYWISYWNYGGHLDKKPYMTCSMVRMWKPKQFVSYSTVYVLCVYTSKTGETKKESGKESKKNIPVIRHTMAGLK